MTKQLLTALLIAGISAMAKAEPTVYYCNTTAFAQVYGTTTDTVRSYPFKLFIEADLGRTKIKIAADELWDLTLDGSKEEDTVYQWLTRPEYGDDAFFGMNTQLKLL